MITWKTFLVSCLALSMTIGMTQAGTVPGDSDSMTCSATDADCQPEEMKANLTGDPNCQDEHESCQHWADIGECTKNPKYMNNSCRRSCELCRDQKKTNPKLAKHQMEHGADMGVAQIMADAQLNVNRDTADKALEEARRYMQETPMEGDLKTLCFNQHEKCTLWAVGGECDANPEYMKRNCAPACHTCHYLTVEGRCPLDPNAIDAWYPGDLDKMFTKFVTDPEFEKYDVNVLSSPGRNDGPWVVTLDNVISEEEALRLIELGSVEGYERSHDVGKLNADGTYRQNVNKGRTSTNAWCISDCYKDEVAQRVIHRLSNITGIEEINSEYLQLLQYSEGQHYTVHHDYITHHIRRQQGVRILTVYLYLNEVEAGGGTNFDQLDITVMPKRGRALIWPSVLDEAPNEKDGRTTHQALPVEKGIKYGANAWFHMRDFKTPHREECQ